MGVWLLFPWARRLNRRQALDRTASGSMARSTTGPERCTHRRGSHTSLPSSIFWTLRLQTLPARALSGGNQQKLIIGREYHVDPKLLLVSQPTRGVDIGAIEFIHRQLVRLRDDGRAILLVSAELEEVTSLSDRLLIIHDGRIAGEVDPKVATLEEIGLLMTRGH